jgi:hypothetical protein
MRKDYEKLFTNLTPPEPPAGLFDRIILAIQREQEFQNTRKIAFGFLALLAVSFASAPFSWAYFSGQVADSGLLQFVSVAISDFGAIITLWPDMFLAVAESLPVAALTVFTINIILAVFTLRLFLHKKRLLAVYFIRGINFV